MKKIQRLIGMTWRVERYLLKVQFAAAEDQRTKEIISSSTTRLRILLRRILMQYAETQDHVDRCMQRYEVAVAHEFSEFVELGKQGKPSHTARLEMQCLYDLLKITVPAIPFLGINGTTAFIGKLDQFGNVYKHLTDTCGETVIDGCKTIEEQSYLFLLEANY